MMEALTDFEAAVLQHLLDGDEPNLRVLRIQLAQASISRTLTGVGFYIDFDVPETCPTISTGACHIGDVEADIGGLVYGAGFVLFLSEGKLRTLEAYSYDEPWPAAIEQYSFRYHCLSNCSSKRTLPF